MSYDDIDHAEHAAVTAEQAAEQASELAHEQQQHDLVEALLALSLDNADRARRSLTAAVEGIDHRLMPTHHYLWAERAQVTAHIAARCATTLDSYRGYDLRGQVEALLGAVIRSTGGGTTGGHVATAAGKVRAVVEQVLAPDARAVDTERANDL